MGALIRKKDNLIVSIADRKVDKSDEEGLKTTNEGDRTPEQDYKKNIKPDCDFMIDNFTSRAEKRTAELGGLRQAKEFLVGYQESAGLSMLAARKSKFLASSASLKAV